ncbi:Protein of uncharacterised function (DUF1576) [Streptococcus merionis]|uniref:Protein of uncharacterized function (DUF1576) n=2 Tax=Streptococcus merionis TaxID=400065 RepID=A0A239STH3_9STRE|nr:Protein of uncharacterised function (DUF1576) [Streptococcus merionis]
MLIRKFKDHLDIHWEKDCMLLLGIVTFLYAMLMPDSKDVITNYQKLLLHQTYLIHDFFEVAGISATFVNVALHFLVAYYLNVRNNLTHLTGFQLAATGIFIGHSFFGTHLLNIVPIIAGVVLYAHWAGHSFKLYTSQSLFATSTAPLVSYLLFSNGVSLQSILLALGVGLLLGFITPPLAEAFLKFHQGYTLYNTGFTTGIIVMIVYACLRYFGYEVDDISMISRHAHWYILVYIGVMSLSFIVLSLLGADLSEIRQKFAKLDKRVGRLPDDFVMKYGRRTTFLNMGLMGITYLLFVITLGMPLNGPIAGGLVSIIGFSAFGKHLRNTLPVAVGVILAGYFSLGRLDDLTVILPLLFGTALAPIAGYYGIIMGMLAGFLQFNLTQSVIKLHLGLSLYNNGFSTGFVAAFMVPVLESIKDQWSAKNKRSEIKK